MHDLSEGRRIPQRRRLRHGSLLRHAAGRRHGLLGHFGAGRGRSQLVDEHLVGIGLDRLGVASVPRAVSTDAGADKLVGADFDPITGTDGLSATDIGADILATDIGADIPACFLCLTDICSCRPTSPPTFPLTFCFDIDRHRCRHRST